MIASAPSQSPPVALERAVALQLIALAGVAPIAYAAAARTMVPAATLITIPFLHVFGSFFFAFSDRNRSATSPRWLAGAWVVWIAASVGLQTVTPRALATFAMLYGGWHIFRQNFGFLRELRGASRRLDLAACAAPAVALWLLLSSRGPWVFLGVEVHHVAVPRWLLAAAFTAVPATALWRAFRGRAVPVLLLLGGNAVALLGPALFLDDLTLIYTLAASYHGLQYLVYLAERERAARPSAHPGRVLAPLASTIALGSVGWLAALTLVMGTAPSAAVDRLVVLAWYAIVPFHYFVDGRIWRRAAQRVA